MNDGIYISIAFALCVPGTGLIAIWLWLVEVPKVWAHQERNARLTRYKEVDPNQKLYGVELVRAEVDRVLNLASGWTKLTGLLAATAGACWLLI